MLYKKSTVEITSEQNTNKTLINSEFDIYANQINIVNKCILGGKKETDFPSMKWKDTINNMLIIDKWKKKLVEINNEKKY